MKFAIIFEQLLTEAHPGGTAQVLAAQARAARTGRPQDQWRCPCCREICNCSGSNCQRARNYLEPTGSLSSEAAHLGYPSVREAPKYAVCALSSRIDLPRPSSCVHTWLSCCQTIIISRRLIIYTPFPTPPPRLRTTSS